MGCAHNPPPQAGTISSAPQKPQLCSDVLAKAAPTPAKFDPQFLATLAKLTNQAPDDIVADTNKAQTYSYNAQQLACRDQRCATLTSVTGSVTVKPADQKPYAVVCTDQAGAETRLSYQPADLDKGP